jgi:hypothetical protein
MKTRISIIVVVLLTLIPTLFAAPIDFDNLNVASTAYGTVAVEGYPRLLAAYNNMIYFIVTEDGTTNPSKVCRYNPSDGLSNTVNHSVIKETTGKFMTLRQIDSLLYFSDNLGHVYFYDGSTITEISGTPFTASDYVSSIEKFKGLIYFASSTGDIFRYDGLTFEPVRQISEDRIIIDMGAWQKDGYLYVSVGPRKDICCPSTGYAIRSSSGDAGSWETVLSGNYYSMLFMPTPDYLYTTVMDSAYCHCSTIRKSSVGTTFPVIYPSDGQYKRTWGAFYYKGIAYFFTDDNHYGFGGIIVDDNGSVNHTVNQKWTLTQAVELNDEIYALASSTAGELQGEVYLITTAPEPAAILQSIEIVGPNSVPEESDTQYQIIGHYDNNSTSDITSDANLIVAPDEFAQIDSNGLLSTERLYRLKELCTIKADCKGLSDSMPVTIYPICDGNECTPLQLAKRDITDVLKIKQGAMGDLKYAMKIERISSQLLTQPDNDKKCKDFNHGQLTKARIKILAALMWEQMANDRIDASVDSLEDALKILQENSVEKPKCPKK